MLTEFFKQLFRRKLVTGICLALIIIGGYLGYQGLTKNSDATRYATATVEKGALIVSLSGSGQVSASDQVDIKPKVSGDVVYVGAEKGQGVKAGALLVQIDSRDAQKAARDAETALETAQLELEKLLQPTDELDLLKAENNLVQAKESKQKTEDDIIKGYEDAFSKIADVFLDLPTVIIGLEDVLYSEEISESESFYQDFDNLSVLKNSINDLDKRNELEKFIKDAENDYGIAREKYDSNFEDYKNIKRYSGQELIEALLDKTIETVRAISETVKSENNLLDYWDDCRSQMDLSIYNQVAQYQSDLNSYTSTINNCLSGLLTIQRSLKDNQEAVVNAERSIKELEMSLEDLKKTADALDIRAKKIAIQQKQDALLTAQQNLADYYIRAPFDGIVASIDVKRGESVSSNAVATLITKQKIAEIALNEIDIAQIKTGQKANITFDAVDGLNITGEVVEIDTLGTVTQGVVTYGVKIAFDTQDERVKPGMTLSTAIITKAKQDALLVPSSAIKQQGDISYVELVNGPGAESYATAANVSNAITASDLKTQSIQTGLSNDTMTEVIDGLKQGDLVVIQTITSNTIQNQTPSSSGFGGGGGQMIRMMR